MVKWASLLTETDRLSMTLKIQGKSFSRLVDSGADILMVSPSNGQMPAAPRCAGLFNVGLAVYHGCETPKKLPYSSTILVPSSTFYFKHPINLWGRDLLQQWGAELVIPPSGSAKHMTKMGYREGQSLGKKPSRAGVGYPFP
ncbi:Hypothetical predicted protein [Lynx pardinus]|uniref:human endogenous retrovirus K endopeptidase n=1 Tax=Lynx pardinus TaxID=191816 RepID=A0A485N2V8_LYNPA|nr:Hypothetical predicted protein [Lynx pardinus]